MLRIALPLKQSATHRYFMLLRLSLLCSRHVRPVRCRLIRRAFSSEREVAHYDVVVVGGGCAGLSAAIKLKRLRAATTVCVVEKSAALGGHILSGNVFEAAALDDVVEDWRTDDTCPVRTAASRDELLFLTAKRAIRCPTPPPLRNDGNFIISLSELVVWLGAKAEALGVDVYCGFAAAEVLYDDANRVCGVATRDVGVGKDGRPKETFSRGMELRARHTVFAEGARGSCTEEVIRRYDGRRESDPQTYGLGIKEVWDVGTAHPHYERGLVQHTLGWPAPTDVWFGSFMYHADNGRVYIGAVVGLDYANTFVSPYNEFQKWKTHPHVRKYLDGGTCIQYGARVINEGGYQSVPITAVDGATLVGCAAGWLNVPKIKGTHLAIKSAVLAAEHITAKLIGADADQQTPFKLSEYDKAIRESNVGRELFAVRNVHPAFHKLGGLYAFAMFAALDAFIFKGRWPFTWTNKILDSDRTLPAAESAPIDYPRADGKLTFDILTNLSRSGVHHVEDQPKHLRIQADMADVPQRISKRIYDGPEQRFCPANVYEFSADDQLIINAANCIHCKTCDIKTPRRYITWTVPEGGGGPNYQGT